MLWMKSTNLMNTTAQDKYAHVSYHPVLSLPPSPFLSLSLPPSLPPPSLPPSLLPSLPPSLPPFLPPPSLPPSLPPSPQVNPTNKELQRDEQFLIRHYAGNVTYTIAAFIDKNKDPVFQDFKRLLYNRLA